MATQPPGSASLVRNAVFRGLVLLCLGLCAVATAARLNHSSSKAVPPGNGQGVSRSGGLAGIVFVGADGAVLLARAETPPAGARPAPGATVSVGSVSGKTDSTGMFNLQNIPAGLDVLHVATADGPNADFPVTIFRGVTAQVGTPRITRAGALAAVMNALSSIHTDPQWTVIMGPQEPLPAGTTVAPAYGDENGQPNASPNYSARSEQWFIYVDPNALLRYSKPVEFFFVDASSGALTKLDEMSWPLINGISYYGSRDASLTSPDLMSGPKAWPKMSMGGPMPRTLTTIIRDGRRGISTRTFEGASAHDGAHLLLASLAIESAPTSRRRFLARSAIPPQAPASASGGMTYGLIVEGANETDENADLSAITQVLGHGGIPPTGDIKYSKPSDTTATTPSGWRAQDVAAKFQQVCAEAGPDDTVFLYITAHGRNENVDGVQLDTNAVDKNGNDVVFDAMGSSSFDFSNCRPCNIIIIIDACYSGKMASNLNEKMQKLPCPPNYTIMTSADSTHQTLGLPLYGGVFTQKFVSEFNDLAAADPNGTVDLTTIYKSAKGQVFNMLYANPQIYVRYPRCPCTKPTNTPCTTSQNNTANQIGTPTGAPSSPNTGTATGAATGSGTCQPTNPTNPPPTNANNNPGGTTIPTPQPTSTIGGGTPESGTNQPGAGGPTTPSGGAVQPTPDSNNLIPNAPGAGGAGALNSSGSQNFLLATATNTASIGIAVTLNQYIAVSLPASAGPSPSEYPTQPTTRVTRPNSKPRIRGEANGNDVFVRPVVFRTRAPFQPFSVYALLDALAEEEPQAGAFGKIVYSIVANGNSSGQALELQVFDPSGSLQEADLPEGIVLEPVKIGSAKPVSESKPGANLLRKSLVAYCVEYMKLPPDPGMLYRIAPQAVQDKFNGIRSVLQAGRELAAAGKFHPDSDVPSYMDSIRQYALWTKIEGWDQQKFGEVFLEKTKENAAAAKVKWTKQMEQALNGLVPGRWRDISMVLEEAGKLSSAQQSQGLR